MYKLIRDVFVLYVWLLSKKLLFDLCTTLLLRTVCVINQLADLPKYDRAQYLLKSMNVSRTSYTLSKFQFFKFNFCC